MLNKEDNLDKSYLIRKTTNKDNVLTYHSLAKHYSLATISEITLSFIKRCFPIVVKNDNFLHLDFSIVVKILDSSELNIHSEVEIFNAAITWLKHNSEERSKYAKQLLLKVRFTLLSEPALKYISNCYSLFSKNQECPNILKEVYINPLKNKSSSCYKSRYCGQNMFNFLLCGGYISESDIVLNTVIKLIGIDFKKTKVNFSMLIERKYSEAVCLKGDIYVFGGCNNACNVVKSVEKYSPCSNEWTVVTNMFDNRRYFCAREFMDKIYVFGGWYLQNFETTNSCLHFNTLEKKLKTIANMNEARFSAACIVFQEKIVVSGGKNDNEDDLNSVESYDVFANRWTPMPKTINDYSFHSLVVVKDKLFVIGQGTKSCEVFDNVCKKFVVFNQQPSINYNKSLSIGNKIVILQEKRSSIVCYDVDKDEWSEESCEVTKHLEGFSYVKFPWY